MAKLFGRLAKLFCMFVNMIGSFTKMIFMFVNPFFIFAKLIFSFVMLFFSSARLAGRGGKLMGGRYLAGAGVFFFLGPCLM